MNRVDAKKMTPTERVLAMETLWESMCSEDNEVESPNWHEDILEARRQKIARGDGGYFTLQQLKEQLAR